jgi:hypothetical protein
MDLFPKLDSELSLTALAKLLFISQTLLLHGVFCSGAAAISFTSLGVRKTLGSLLICTFE